MAGKLTPEVQALALQGTLDTFSLPDVLRLAVGAISRIEITILKRSSDSQVGNAIAV